MRTDYDVIVIGAGPVGLTLANILGGNGVSVALVESRTELIDYPRAVGIDDEALRVMQSIGLVEHVLPHTVPDQSIRVVNGDRKVIAQIAPTTREFGWPRRNGFVQPLVDQVLLSGLDRFPNVSVMMGTVAVELRDENDKATVTVDKDGQRYELHATYVVGCEGGRSLTRRHLGLRFDGKTRITRGLVIDVADDPVGTPHAVFGGDPNRGYATLALPHGIRRWEFTMKEGEDESLADDDAFVHGLLSDHVVDPSSLNIIRRRVYAHHARVAEKLRVGRFFLAGDAAHVMPVVAGQGWNSGIRDAVNLGWKLAAVVTGIAGDRLLDTYETERLPHVKAMVQLSLNMSNVVTDSNKWRTAARDVAANVVKRIPMLNQKVNNQGFKPVAQYSDGVVVPTTTYRLKSLPSRENAGAMAGSLFPQPFVKTGNGETRRLDDATGQGWRVIAWSNDPTRFISDDVHRVLESLDAHMVRVVPAEQLPHHNGQVGVVGDPDGMFKDWFNQRDCSVFVIRPDHIVAADCVPQDLDRTLREVFLRADVTVK